MPSTIDNAYQVKFKLIPANKQYKTSFIQGISIAKNQESAVKESNQQVKEAVSKEGFDVEVKLQSVIKLRKDFLIFVADEKK
jgi:uncharacterized protein (UPF0335 family)